MLAPNTPTRIGNVAYSSNSKARLCGECPVDPVSADRFNLQFANAVDFLVRFATLLDTMSPTDVKFSLGWT